jgi:hypothetical protein
VFQYQNSWYIQKPLFSWRVWEKVKTHMSRYWMLKNSKLYNAKSSLSIAILIWYLYLGHFPVTPWIQCSNIDWDRIKPTLVIMHSTNLHRVIKDTLYFVETSVHHPCHYNHTADYSCTIASITFLPKFNALY